MKRFALTLLWLLLVQFGCVRQNHNQLSLNAPQLPSGPSAAKPLSLAETLFNSRKSYRVGDSLKILVAEKSTAQSKNSTDAQRSEEISAQAAILDLKARQAGMGSKSAFAGKGGTQREESLQTEISCMVHQIYPNGLLFVAGDKEIKLNEQLSYVAVSGVVNPRDIDEDNSLRSDRLAYARITITGDSVRRGWFAQLFDLFWPF